MSTVTATFYAAATLLLGIIAVSAIPTGGWGGQAETVRAIAVAVTIGGPVFFIGTAILGRDRLGD